MGNTNSPHCSAKVEWAVYLAQHKLINRKLAVKFLHPQYADNEEVVTRFQREAQSAARIGHENIIEITDMGTASDGAPYIVMEFLDGDDVKGVLESDGVFTVARAANIMVQALSALQAAHNAGIIHRDLKPENIYLTKKSSNPDYVKLLDFGISKFKELETDGKKALTQTGTVLGTPHYMSPEQARGEQNLTPRSDIYAMGVILYQMMTGHLPFDAPNYNALLIKILTEDPPLPETLNPDLPDDIAETIKIAMARDLNERFETCEEFKARLIPYVPGLADATGSVDLSTVSRTAIRRARTNSTRTPLEMTQSGISQKKNRLPIIIGAAAAAVLAVGIGVFAALNSGGSGNTEQAPQIAVPPPETKEPVKEELPQPTAEREDENQIELTVSASPAEAVIAIDGAEVPNPYTGYFAKSKLSHSIVVTAAGFTKHAEMVVFDTNKTLSYQLEPVPEVKATKSTRKKSSDDQKADPEPATTPAGDEKPSKKPRRKIDYADPWS